MYKKIIKNIFKKFGLEIKKYNPQDDFNFLITRCIKKFQIDCFWDVGANIGQTGESIRKHGYTGNILSFEPQEEAYKKLLKNSFNDQKWKIYEKCGLGQNGFKKINISKNSVSSSFLEMENLHIDKSPESKFIKKEEVKIISLSEVFNKEKNSFKKNFLKIDTQGYEKEVLDSGENILDNFIGISCEISVQPLYKNEAKFLDIINYLNTKGFEIYSVHNSYYEIDYGQTFSVDIVFIKKDLFIN
jgi:FkbM family methyltransferase